MTRPPPPDPYETWLDYLLIDPYRNGYKPSVNYAAAELAELRAENERLKRECGLLRGLNNDLIARRAVQTFATNDTTGRNPCDPADEYLRNARKA